MPHPQRTQITPIRSAPELAARLRSYHAEALEHRRAAESAADLSVKFTREELLYVTIAAICVFVSIGMVVAICFSTLPIPVNS